MQVKVILATETESREICPNYYFVQVKKVFTVSSIYLMAFWIFWWINIIHTIEHIIGYHDDRVMISAILLLIWSYHKWLSKGIINLFIKVLNFFKWYFTDIKQSVPACQSLMKVLYRCHWTVLYSCHLWDPH